ncbi:MAG: gliding motility-associated C-terminal domain-containing protein [Flavobacteriia bacterium]|jgi:gliding motility-associated-like protein
MKALNTTNGVFFSRSVKSFALSVMTFVIATTAFAQPSNDNPCNATPLTAGTACTYTAGTNVGATNTAGVPAPGCAAYVGQDVWFSVVVPAGGTLNFDSNTGSMTDGGMAIYSGTCTSLTLLACNDDSSPNGLMPYIALTGQTPGTTLYIRFWDYAGGTGTFSICVVAPPPPPSCVGNPPAGNDCASATPICELNGYCGSTASTYTANSWPQLTTAFCGSIENNSFISFVASSTTVSFNVWVTSSTLNYGIQMFIFSATGCAGAVTSFTCWNPGTAVGGPSTVSASGLIVGNTYYIMVDGNAGDVCNYIIGANSGVNIPVNLTPVTSSVCSGGSVNLTATGGNGTYTWTPAAGLSATTGANVTVTPPTTPGTYTYTVNSSTGNPLCPSSTSATASITVTGAAAINAGADVAICTGQNVTLNATGGATYTWSPAITNGVPFSPPSTTTYTVTGTTAAGCVGTDQVVVTVNPSLSVYAGPDVTVCSGQTVTLSGSGMNTYTWSSAVTNAVAFTPTATGIYTVTGTSTGGCTSTDQVLVTVNPLPTVNAGADVTLCAGQTAALSATGANSYTWSPLVTNGVAFNPSATATYTVTGTASNGCTNTDQVLVTVNPLPIVNGGADVSICTGQSVTLTATGANTYSWSPLITNGVAFAPVATGTYTVTGTTASGCVNTDQVLVTVNTLPTINGGTDVVVCDGQAATLTASGAATYSWSPAVTNGVAFTPAATGTYTVTGTTASGCTNTDQVLVTVNPLPTVNGGADVTICAGEAVTLTASGATIYSWSPAATNGVAFSPSTSATYTVTGTSALGCQNTDMVMVNVNQLPNVSAGADQSVCVGTQVTLIGLDAVSYTWSPAITDGVPFTPPTGTTTYTVTGTSAAGCINTDQVVVTVNTTPLVDAGTYPPVCSDVATVALVGAPLGGTYTGTGVTGTNFATSAGTQTVTYSFTDANGCFGSTTATITVNALPAVAGGADVTICEGQTITLTATGATTYSWSPAANNGVAFNPLTSGTYTVTGTDVNGCLNTDQVVVTVNPLPIVSAGADQTVCIGVQVTLSGSGAATYSWSPTITDGVAFTSPNGTTTYVLTGTSVAGCTSTDAVDVTVNTEPSVNAGTYSAVCIDASAVALSGTPAGGTFSGTGVTGTSFNPASGTQTITYDYTDPNGCSGSAIASITVNPLPTIAGGTDATVCAGQTITLSASGGVNYTWSPAATNGVAFAPAATATYTVTGTSAAGCTSTDQVAVTVNALPVVNAGTDQAVCIGTQVTLTATGASTYSWSPSITNGTAFVPPVGTTVYTATGTSAAGCVSTDAVQVISYSSPTVNAGTYTPVCIDASSVALLGTPAGGTFSGIGVIGTTFNPASGTQTVTYNYTDANGCSGSGTATIIVNPLPVVDAGTYTPICADAADLPLVGSPAGGTFSGTGVTANAFDPSANTQTVTYTYTNANGCVNTDVATITVVQLTPTNAGTYTPVCIDAANVVLNGTPAGGTFTGTGVTAGTFDPSVGTQTITYTYSDAIGCTASATATIVVNPLPVVGAGAAQVICEGTTVTLNGTGATTYTWSGGALNGQSFTPSIGQNVYTVSGTDANGCVSTATVNINVLPFPIASLTSDVQTGNPVLDVNFANGSQFGTTYDWNFGNGNTYTSNLTEATSESYAEPGTYIVTLIASNGLCSSVDSLEIIVLPFGDPEVIVPNVFSPNDDDVNDIFFLQHLYTEEIYIVILNRWGDVVFETTDPDPQWNGTTPNGNKVTDGVYFYKYVATGINGVEIKGHGDVTVVR